MRMIVLFLCVLASPVLAGSVPLDYAIVTDQALAPSFQPLADYHSAHGHPAEVHTRQEIQALYPVAFDDAERVRLWIKDMATARGLAWVLIGGDASVVPMRQVLVRATAIPPMLYTDAYYACLDGTWDADGDGIYGEQPEDGGQETPQLRVGRAPVLTPAEAQAFVAKTLAAHAAIDRAAPLDALLAANVIELGPTVIDRAQAGEVQASILATRPGTHAVRLYQNSGAWPGSFPENAASVYDSLGAGCDLAILNGQGGVGLFQAGSYPADLLNDAQFASLANPAPGVAFFNSAYATVPGPTSVGRGMILAPGGAAAVLGQTDVQFTSLGDAGAESFLKAAILQHKATVGEAWAVAATPLYPGVESARLSTLGLTLFGDPLLPMPGSAEVPVPLRLSLVESSVSAGEARLSWYAAEASGAARVERRTTGEDWSVIGEARASGQGSFDYVDHVAAGQYGYRLRIGSDVSDATWLDVPAAVATLALSGFRPNPAGAARTVSFSLASSEDATLTLVDVRGRTVARREVGSLGPGPHTVDLGGGVKPGVYWLRLVQKGRSELARGVVAR